MKLPRICYFLPILITLFFIYNPEIFAQKDLSIGTELGGGIINGNLPSQGSFTSELFFEMNPGFSENFLTRLSFIYNVDYNILLPQAAYRYYPFVRGFSLKGLAYQSYSQNLFMEEGLGPLMLSDHTFSNLDETDWGLAFSILAGIDLRKNGMKNGFKVGVGAEYGLTFTNTQISYFSIHFQLQLML
jgi:hypothetical protein